MMVDTSKPGKCERQCGNSNNLMCLVVGCKPHPKGHWCCKTPKCLNGVASKKVNLCTVCIKKGNEDA